ncbi:terminase [Leuconostoc suionicum]|uniref:terminase n=1 Tax=Leuconostoc suionicum TaxID=1511761 RepID=UPI00233E8592|nr:terminase [Leuconostoc suionicum]MDC2815440.1 terminase [Leuconostoc suionicum]
MFVQQLLSENKLHFIKDDNILESALLNARISKNDFGIKVVKDTYSNKIDNLVSVLIGAYESRYALVDYTTENSDDPFAGKSQSEINEIFENYTF